MKVFWLITEGTVEEMMYLRQVYKQVHVCTCTCILLQIKIRHAYMYMHMYMYYMAYSACVHMYSTIHTVYDNHYGNTLSI